MLAVDSRLRKQPSQARSRLTVDAFLEAADRILRRDGYEAASTNRLARVAGFSVGSLYQYFDDKQAVIGTLVDRELRREARGLVEVLEDRQGEDLPDLLRALLVYLIGHRLESAHLHRALADYGEEFGGDGALAYIQRQQAPLASDALQRVASGHLLRTGDSRLQPRLDIAAGLVQAVTHWLAVEAPAHVTPEALTDVLVRTLTAYLASVEAPAPEACGVVAAWRDDAKRERSARERRARRMQEVRTYLLRATPEGMNELEPAVFVGSGVYDLIFGSGHRPTAHSQDELSMQFARMIEALPR